MPRPTTAANQAGGSSPRGTELARPFRRKFRRQVSRVEHERISLLMYRRPGQMKFCRIIREHGQAK